MSSFFFFNDTATTEIYTLSPTRRSSDLGCDGVQPVGKSRRRIRGGLELYEQPGEPGRSLGEGHGPDLRADRKVPRSEEHTSELQSRSDLVCRLLLEKKKPGAVHGRHVHR